MAHQRHLGSMCLGRITMGNCSMVVASATKVAPPRCSASERYRVWLVSPRFSVPYTNMRVSSFAILSVGRIYGAICGPQDSETNHDLAAVSSQTGSCSRSAQHQSLLSPLRLRISLHSMLPPLARLAESPCQLSSPFHYTLDYCSIRHYSAVSAHVVCGHPAA
jgi:hypothetical protein